MTSPGTDSSPLDLSALHNQYWGLRHGTSEAIELGIIAYDPDGLGGRYGLTKQGREEVTTSVTQALMQYPQLKNCVFFVSPLRRTQETAGQAAKILTPTDRITASEIRERNFAEFEGQSIANCSKIWPYDAEDPSSEPFGVESVNAVRSRFFSLIRGIEDKYQGSTILLISHGDPLHIIQAAFQENHPPVRPNQNLHFKPAEIHRLN